MRFATSSQGEGKKAHPETPRPDAGKQQAIAEKDPGSSASIKARIDSSNMPDKPALNHQHTPNSSGRR